MKTTCFPSLLLCFLLGALIPRHGQALAAHSLSLTLSQTLFQNPLFFKQAPALPNVANTLSTTDKTLIDSVAKGHRKLLPAHCTNFCGHFDFQHLCWCDQTCGFFNDCCANLEEACPSLKQVIPPDATTTTDREQTHSTGVSNMLKDWFSKGKKPEEHLEVASLDEVGMEGDEVVGSEGDELLPLESVEEKTMDGEGQSSDASSETQEDSLGDSAQNEDGAGSEKVQETATPTGDKPTENAGDGRFVAKKVTATNKTPQNSDKNNQPETLNGKAADTVTGKQEQQKQGLAAKSAVGDSKEPTQPQALKQEEEGHASMLGNVLKFLGEMFT